MPLLALLVALLDALAHDADTADPTDPSARRHRAARNVAGLVLVVGSLVALAVWWAHQAPHDARVTLDR